MAHSAKILADSLSPDGVRLITYELVMPRIVLSEFNTHRILKGMDEDPVSWFSRNSASSRAIPVRKMIKRVMEDPYIPSVWGKNQKGMQADENMDEYAAGDARDLWLVARDNAVLSATRLLKLGIHKQLTNRLLEPFMWHTVICTATELSNFFHLRNHEMAHPDIAIVAKLMQELYESKEPKKLAYGEWHLPLVSDEEVQDWIVEGMPNSPDIGPEMLARHVVLWAHWSKVSVGRCARVSYLTHDGKRDPQADIDLHDRLLENGHLSPCEHVARPARAREDFEVAKVVGADHEYGYGKDGDDPHPFTHPAKQWHGNLRGWVSYRSTIPGEADIMGEKP